MEFIKKILYFKAAEKASYTLIKIKILFFSSPDCSICDNQNHVLIQLADKGIITYENRLITAAFDLALRYGVRSAPTIVYLYKDRPVLVSPGFQSAEAITATLNLLQNG